MSRRRRIVLSEMKQSVLSVNQLRWSSTRIDNYIFDPSDKNWEKTAKDHEWLRLSQVQLARGAIAVFFSVITDREFFKFKWENFKSAN